MPHFISLYGIFYNAAPGIKHKLMKSMTNRDDQFLLSGIIQIDDSCMGGRRHDEEVGVKFVSPSYPVVIAWLPADSAEMIYEAIPPGNVPVTGVIAQSLKSTVSAGKPPPVSPLP